MNKSKGTLLAKISILTYGLMLAHDILAQTFLTLNNFAAGSAGSSPYDGLVLSGNTVYGTAYFEALDNGSAVIRGTVFAMGRDGRGFTNLHTFPPYDELTPRNSEGNGPIAGLTLAGSRLYGTTVAGGDFGKGTVFAMNTDGTGFSVLHHFNSSNDGNDVRGRLVLAGNTLYGSTGQGGSVGNGTVFALSTNGAGFRVLHNFTAGDDGGGPYGTVTVSSNTLYGTTSYGFVASVNGTVFSLNVDGTDFKVLHAFTTASPTNSDGTAPFGGLILSSNMLYGSASRGGSGGNGTLFAMNTDGTGFRVLHSFTMTPRPAPAGGGSLPATNSDGALPHGELILSNNTLYGAAAAGGDSSRGTVYAIKTDGTDFTVLHDFEGNSDGWTPNGGLILSGNTLYGTALFGGSSGNGTVFSISFSPRLTLLPLGSNVLLSWPTNYAGFDYSGYVLQSTTNLASAIWTSNSSPVVINGRKTGTNSISASQQFFRLSQ